MRHSDSGKVGDDASRCGYIHKHERKLVPVDHGATVSLLSLYIERNANAYEGSSRRDGVPIALQVLPGFAASPLIPI